MRKILGLLAIGAAAYGLSKRGSADKSQGRAAFADNQTGAGDNPVRDAGPEAMRDPPQNAWSGVDQASDESFPASDPPSTY